MKLTGNIVSGNEFFFGEIAWENGKITSITSKDVPVADADLILPGFIDIHTHGGGGCRFEILLVNSKNRLCESGFVNTVLYFNLFFDIFQ